MNTICNKMNQKDSLEVLNSCIYENKFVNFIYM